MKECCARRRTNSLTYGTGIRIFGEYILVVSRSLLIAESWENALKVEDDS